MNSRQGLSEIGRSQEPISAGSEFTVRPSVSPLFRRIPPERVGLCGEYDYSGLSKRVEHCFYQHYSPDDLSAVRISQRGAIVLLRGRFKNPELMHQLVVLALGVDGAAGIEVNGETIFPPLRACHLGLVSSMHLAG